MAIPVNVGLALVALFASLCVAWECGEAVNETIQYYIPGQWDLYHKGELVKSDCSMDEATDYVFSDAHADATVASDGEWVFTYHGESASDGFTIENKSEHKQAWREIRNAALKALEDGIVTDEEYEIIVHGR